MHYILFICYLNSQVLTAIYPTPVATGVVSMTTVPASVAAPAQDPIRGSSLDGSSVATPQPNVALEVKREGHLDCQAENDGHGASNLAARPSSVTCALNAAAGN